MTIRTLRYYDKVGLLRPSARSNGDHRLYTDRDLVRLQQILTLKFLGFSLEQVRGLLTETPADPLASLQMQRELMVEKRRLLDKVIQANLLAVIRVTQMENNHWEKFYSESARAKLRERQQSYTPEDAQRDAQRWQVVLDGFRQAFAAGLDPASEQVQALAAQHVGLINEFTQGDPQIAQGLQNMYTSPDRPYPSPYGSKAEADYVQRALDLFRQSH